MGKALSIFPPTHQKGSDRDVGDSWTADGRMRHATHSIMRRGVGSLLVLGALIFAAAGDAAGVDEDQGGQREVLAASDFVWDLDGWGVVGEECKPLSHGPKMARGGDLGNATWCGSPTHVPDPPALEPTRSPVKSGDRGCCSTCFHNRMCVKGRTP